MIKNYLKIAWRNLMKNKVFSFINIFGLAVGLTCCMMISLYVYQEYTYDTHHKNADRIYQLGTTFVKEGKEDHTPNTPSPMARIMQLEFPEIEIATRLMKTFADDKTLFQYTTPAGDRNSFYETNGYLADSNFFHVLTYNFKEGDPNTALRNANSLVISEEIAQKIFGKEQAINKTIRISSSTNGDFDFTVTGVFIPSQTPSHIDAKFFMSFLGGGMYQSSSQQSSLATNNMYYTYFLLKPGSDPKKLEAKFPDFIRKYAGEDLKAMGFYKKQFVTRISDLHLYSKIKKNVTPAGSLTYLYILISIAAFTLLIACINFMNLSTARSSKRSAEVGVRKVLGAEKSALIRQFLGESLMMSIIAFLFALLFTKILLPVFSKVAGKTFSFSFEQYFIIVGSFFLLAIITGFLAGSYPAFYLSSFKPVKVLKGKIANTLAVVSFRRALVVFQFVISVVLIVASVVISNQMKYLRSADLGFTEDQQIVIPLRSGTAKNIYASLKTELGSQKDIKSVGASLYYPGIMNPSDMPFYKEGGSVNDSKRFFMNWVDDGFLSTLEIKPLAGRIFSPQFLADTGSRMVINEQGTKELGFKSPQDAVGKFALFDWQGETYRYEIVGVVKDFHFKDLHVPIEPCGMQLINRPQFNYIVAHANTNSMSRTLKAIEAKWKNLNPNEPFEYSFMDQDFQKNYVSDERLASIVTYFTIIAIVISCLGLFGLAAFSAEQRIKEIGVRKVLGANVGNIITLLSKDFVKLVVIAIIIASPIAWFAMNKWLQDFAYRTPINWQVFAITALIAVFIALATVSFQAIKAAIANPVKSLRTE